MMIDIEHVNDNNRGRNNKIVKAIFTERSFECCQKGKTIILKRKDSTILSLYGGTNSLRHFVPREET